MKEEVKLHIYSADLTSELNLPYVDSGIKAGFPSPAQDYLTESIDLNKALILHTETTFYAKAQRIIRDTDVDVPDGNVIAVVRIGTADQCTGYSQGRCRRRSRCICHCKRYH